MPISQAKGLIKLNRAMSHAKETPILHDSLCGLAVQHLYEFTRSNQLLCERYYYRDKVLVGLRQHLEYGHKIHYGAVLVACFMLAWDAHDSWVTTREKRGHRSSDMVHRDEFFRCLQGIFLVSNMRGVKVDHTYILAGVE